MGIVREDVKKYNIYRYPPKPVKLSSQVFLDAMLSHFIPHSFAPNVLSSLHGTRICQTDFQSTMTQYTICQHCGQKNNRLLALTMEERNSDIG